MGPKFAKKIVQQFGTDTLEIIETDVKRLLEVPGIGKKRVDKITESWERQKEIKNVMYFCRIMGSAPPLLLRFIVSMAMKASKR